MNSVASPLNPVVLWLILEIVGHAVFSLVAAVSAPVRRPVWAIFMRAKSPWPAAVLAGLGIASGVAGAMLLQKPNASDWESGFGLALFFCGAFVALAGPAFWFDERNRLRSRTALRTTKHLATQRCSRRAPGY